MGQHSSKRRSYTPGQDVQSEIPSVSLANGDVSKYDVTANGGIEAHSKDVQLRGSKSSKTPVERQSSSTSGKKDKSKKIRIIGISLRRTPSGRWTRKRRSMRANGSTRPASCPPADLTPKVKGTQPRPQSLFEEEVISEDDGKIETVDLSDHDEDNKQAKAAADPVPKPRDKKAKRSASDKRQGSKKRKKEKKNSKKDKTKRPTSPKTTKAPDVPEASSSNAAEKPADDDTKPVEEHSTDEVSTSPAQAEPQNQNEATDINAVASSIVQQSITIARDRLISEEENTRDGNENSKEKDSSNVDDLVNENALNDDTSAPTPVQDVISTPETVTQNESAPVTSSNDDAPEVEEDMIIPSKALVKEMAPTHFKDQEHEEEENDIKSDEKPKEPLDVQVEIVKNEFESANTEDNQQKKTEILNEFVLSSPSSDIVPHATNDAEEIVEETIVMEKIDKVKTLPPPPSSSSPVDEEDKKDNYDKNSEQVESEVKDNVEEILTEAVEGKNEVECEFEKIKEMHAEMSEENKEMETDVTVENCSEEAKEHKGDVHADAALSDHEADKKHKAKLTKEQKEKEKAEKDRLKKQREEEKAKEKERLKEEKRKKAEQKSSEKVKLRGQKGDRKSTISKRLSDWFKKDKVKTPDSSTANAEDKNDEDVPGPSGISVDSNAESVAVGSSDSQQSWSSQPPDSSASQSLTVDVSVQPLPDLSSTDADQNRSPSPIHTNNASPDTDKNNVSPDFAPNSPVSNDISSSEPTTPTLDGEKSESSGVLKKILLGPRLRTAILRKKSSGASDSGSEDNRVSLTQPKGVETTEVTAPPRKLRPRKPVEQYSPVTLGAHNPLKNPSPRLEHTDKDSLPNDGSELNISCQDSLPNQTEDEELSSSNILVVDASSNDVKDEVEDSSQSLNDHLSAEDEPNKENTPVAVNSSFSNVTIEAVEDSLQTTVSVEDSLQTLEKVEDSLQTSSSESQSENDSTSISATSEEVIEQSHTQTVSLEALPSIDTVPSKELNVEVVENVCEEVKSEINQNQNENNDQCSSSENVDQSYKKQENTSEHENEEEGENKSEDSSEEAALKSPTVVSTASIVLRSSSNEGNEAISVVSESSVTQSEVDTTNSVTGDLLQQNEISSFAFSNENCSESVGDNSEVVEGEAKESEEKKSEDVLTSLVENLDEVKNETSQGAVKISEDEHEESDGDDKEEDDECTPSQYKVVCTAMATDEQDGSSESREEPSVSVGDAKEDSVDENKSEVEALVNCNESETQNSIASEEFSETSDSSNDNNDIASASPSSDKWEIPKLDIHLDDSAIEMDKESPLSDAQSPLSDKQNPLLKTQTSKNEDEGVNSDHSSEGNDLGSEGIENKTDGSNSKADSTDTIEAYLKLQQHVDDVKNVSMKNHHINDNCGGLIDTGVLRSANGVDVDDHQEEGRQDT